MPIFTKINFNHRINSSLQIGDLVYVASILDGGRTSEPEYAEKVVQIGSSWIKINKNNTTSPIISTTQNNFILFAKDIRVNESSLKGYYADITLANSSGKRAELFAVSSEVVLSSK